MQHSVRRTVIFMNVNFGESLGNTEQYYCFADFEFTCGEHRAHSKTEMLSVGLVVCDGDFEIVETYYDTACPIGDPVLSDKCRELTHLTQTEILDSADSDSVLEVVDEILRDYGIEQILVWGNFDRTGLNADAARHKRTHHSYLNISAAARKIVDIQPQLVEQLDLPEAIKISELSGAFGYVPDEGSFHNAMNDAMGLYVICKSAYTTDFSANSEFTKLKEFRAERKLAAKLAAAEHRKEIALSVPLTSMEQDFLDRQSEENRPPIEEIFYNFRYRILYRFKSCPDCKDFMLMCFNYPRRVKVLPLSEYIPDKTQSAVYITQITRTNFAPALIKSVESVINCEPLTPIDT